jgi:hypothetical protein
VKLVLITDGEEMFQNALLAAKVLTSFNLLKEKKVGTV